MHDEEATLPSPLDPPKGSGVIPYFKASVMTYFRKPHGRHRPGTA